MRDTRGAKRSSTVGKTSKFFPFWTLNEARLNVSVLSVYGEISVNVKR